MPFATELKNYILEKVTEDPGLKGAALQSAEEIKNLAVEVIQRH